jgi:hypothetical protein
VVDDHPEFAAADLVEAAQAAIREPDCVTADRNFGRRECFYRKAPKAYGPLLVKVVVEFTRLRNRGMVVTAYRVPAVTRGERELWRRP